MIVGDILIPQPSKRKKQFKLKDFQLNEQIGSGKFGIIFKAKQIQTGQILALKMIPKKKIQNVQLYIRLKNQVQIQSRLKFLHICQLHCYFHDKNCVYLVLQFCQNFSLYHPGKYIFIFKVKVENTYFTEQQIAKFIYQLLLAVDFLHQRQVLHRDIKLENLLLDQNMDIKLTDFGCSVHTSEERKTFCGTLEYICPEMIYKRPYNSKVDIYCVGVVMYQLFYLQTPFKGEDQDSTLKNIRIHSIHFNQKVRAIPQKARDLILSMLSKDNQKRPTARQALEHDFFKYYYVGKVYKPEQLQIQGTRNQ